jgi:hypothetical protein
VGDVEENDYRSLEIEDLLMAPPTEASLRRQVTDLLLNGLRGIRTDRLTLEQSEVLRRIEAALETYRSYFYPPEHR